MELKIRRILVPVDQSPGTEEAVSYAALMAKALSASVTLLHVDASPNAMVGIVPGASIEGDLADLRRAALEWLSELKVQLTAQGVPDVETLVLTAPSIAPAMVDAARARPFDLIVMGTHARTGAARFLVGSVAEEVLRHAHCPVLTVHLPPER